MSAENTAARVTNITFVYATSNAASLHNLFSRALNVFAHQLFLDVDPEVRQAGITPEIAVF
jgi:hypothetical protein